VKEIFSILNNFVESKEYNQFVIIIDIENNVLHTQYLTEGSGTRNRNQIPDPDPYY